jgi:hypothetical protein
VLIEYPRNGSRRRASDRCPHRTALTWPLIVLAASVSLATIGCREQSAPPPPGGPNTGGGTMPGGEPVPIDAAGAPVSRMNAEIADDDARALAIAALDSAQRTALKDGTDSPSLLQLVGWRPNSIFESGRQSISLIYIVIHPIGVQPLWSTGGRGRGWPEALDSWAMENVLAVGHDERGYSLLHQSDEGRNDFALITRGRPSSRVLDLNGQHVEVIETSHVALVPPVRLQARPHVPTWSPLVLTLDSHEQAGRDIRVLIGVSESTNDENPR